MQEAAKLIGAAGTAAAALAVLASVHNRTVDTAADAALLVSLLGLVRVAFSLVDDPEDGDEDRD